MPRKMRKDAGRAKGYERTDAPKEMVSHNIREMMHEDDGRPRDQKIAIAYSKARRGEWMGRKKKKGRK